MDRWADKTELESIKVGDTIHYEFGVTYLVGIHKTTVTRITKTQIICGNEKFSRRDGIKLPKDRFVNAYILSKKGK